MFLKRKGKIIAISKTSAMHFFRLAMRSGLFLAAFILYIAGKLENDDILFGALERFPLAVLAICAILIFEMILRFFPEHLESMGCQKQFRRNYRPEVGFDHPLSKEEKRLLRKVSNTKGVLVSLLAWIALNLGIWSLYWLDIIDSGILLLVALAYSICDIICILYFCPFQQWFMKNKCCTTCRIYNWDYAMMFTPMIVVNNIYARILFILSFCLLIRWEVTFYRHPERFAEVSNASLHCENCQEKLCQHKTALQHYLTKWHNKNLTIPSIKQPVVDMIKKNTCNIEEKSSK